VLLIVNRKGYVLNEYFFHDQWVKKWVLRTTVIIFMLGGGFSLTFIPKYFIEESDLWMYFVMINNVCLMILPLFYPLGTTWLFEVFDLAIPGDLINFNNVKC
jgi:hypothetical protein